MLVRRMALMASLSTSAQTWISLSLGNLWDYFQFQNVPAINIWNYVTETYFIVFI